MANILEILLRSSGGEAVEKSIKGVSGETAALTKVTNQLASLISVGALAVGIKQCIASYMQQEEATVRLNSALRTQGVISEDVSKSFLDQASALQSLSGFDDDAITSGQALAITMGVQQETVKAMTPLVVDFASAVGVDLRTAFMIMGRAALGEVGMLKRYGVIVDEGKLKTDGFNAVLATMQKNFGGSAEAVMKSGVGPMRSFNVTMNEVKETIGKTLLPGLNDLLKTFDKLLKNLTGENKETENNMKLQAKVHKLRQEGNLTLQQKLTLDYHIKKGTEESLKLFVESVEKEKKAATVRVELSSQWKQKQAEAAAETEKLRQESLKKEEEAQEYRDEIREKDLKAAREAYLKKYEMQSQLADQAMTTADKILEYNLVGIENSKNADIKAATERYEANKKNIEKTITDEETKSEKLGMLEQGYSAEVENIRTIADNEEKKRRNELKPIMIAQAIANTAEGVTKALAQGGIFGLATAALVGAAGAAEVAIIQKQQFQSGTQRVPGAEGAPVLAVVHGGEEIRTRQQSQSAGGGNHYNLYFTVSGTFIEADRTKWDRLVREDVWPALQSLLRKSGEQFSGG